MLVEGRPCGDHAAAEPVCHRHPRNETPGSVTLPPSPGLRLASVDKRSLPALVVVRDQAAGTSSVSSARVALVPSLSPSIPASPPAAPEAGTGTAVEDWRGGSSLSFDQVEEVSCEEQPDHLRYRLEDPGLFVELQLLCCCRVTGAAMTDPPHYYLHLSLEASSQADSLPSPQASSFYQLEMRRCSVSVGNVFIFILPVMPSERPSFAVSQELISILLSVFLCVFFVSVYV